MWQIRSHPELNHDSTYTRRYGVEAQPQVQTITYHIRVSKQVDKHPLIKVHQTLGSNIDLLRKISLTERKLSLWTEMDITNMLETHNNSEKISHIELLVLRYFKHISTLTDLELNSLSNSLSYHTVLITWKDARHNPSEYNIFKSHPSWLIWHDIFLLVQMEHFKSHPCMFVVTNRTFSNFTPPS